MYHPLFCDFKELLCVLEHEVNCFSGPTVSGPIPSITPHCNDVEYAPNGTLSISASWKLSDQPGLSDAVQGFHAPLYTAPLGHSRSSIPFVSHCVQVLGLFK